LRHWNQCDSRATARPTAIGEAAVQIALVLTEAAKQPDPAVVTPGLVGLVITLLLGVAVFLLYKSLRRQLNRIEVPERDDPRISPGQGDEQPRP
jgi:hypothetical protein